MTLESDLIFHECETISVQNFRTKYDPGRSIFSLFLKLLHSCFSSGIRVQCSKYNFFPLINFL